MELPKRKHPRLKEYDYSQNGYYFIAVNTYSNLPVLGRVGRGLAPAETKISLTPIGKVCEEQLFELKKRYDYIKIDKYVIMPTHIHAIIVLNAETAGESGAAGASPRPTLHFNSKLKQIPICRLQNEHNPNKPKHSPTGQNNSIN